MCPHTGDPQVINVSSIVSKLPLTRRLCIQMVLANSLRGFLDLASLTAWTLGTGAPAQKPLHLAPSQLLASDSAPSGASSAISPEVSAFAEALREAHGIHGISVGVVRLDAGVVTSEFGTWGTMTEEGDPVRKEVSCCLACCCE